MREEDLTKIRFVHWIENLSDQEIARLTSDAQACVELDRCFTYCLDADCDYYNLLLLARTPTNDFRQSVIDWIGAIDEDDLKDLLEKGVICGEQSFCMRYCGAIDCLFRRLIRDLCAIGQFTA